MATDQKTLIVHMGQVDPAQAARAYAAHVHLDPQALATPESLAAAGPSFGIQTQDGATVFTLSAAGGECWVHAAAGTGYGMTAPTFAIIEQIAARAGCNRVAFQTVRRGLVRRARRLGYQIAGEIGRGHILRKNLQ